MAPPRCASITLEHATCASPTCINTPPLLIPSTCLWLGVVGSCRLAHLQGLHELHDMVRILTELFPAYSHAYEADALQRFGPQQRV